MLLKLNNSDIQALFYLIFRSVLSRARLIDELTEFTLLLIEENYHLRDKEKMKELLRTEFVTLLYDLKRGKVKVEDEKKFAHYLENRINRALLNAYRNGVLLVEAEDERWGTVLFVPEREQEENKKRKIKQVKKEKTYRKELSLLLNAGFKENKFEQLNLF